MTVELWDEPWRSSVGPTAESSDVVQRAVDSGRRSIPRQPLRQGVEDTADSSYKHDNTHVQ